MHRVFTSTAITTATEDAAYSYSITTADADAASNTDNHSAKQTRHG